VSAGLVLRDGAWVPYTEERAEARFDPNADMVWREEAFGEHPILGPWGDPFHGPESDEPLECGLENPEVCESCQ